MLENAMKPRWITVLSCLAILGASQAQTKPAPQEDVIHFIEEYDRAWNSKDASAVARLLAPDYVYFSSTGQVQSRQHMLDMMASPKYILASAERSEMKMYRMSGTAVVSSRWRGHGSYDGKEFRDDQRCSIVLVRDGQRWLVLSEHCTQIVAP
jgi:ketosteroid isomerase-like protein